MTKHEIYDIWAPKGEVWSDWVKPVLFGCMEEYESSPADVSNEVDEAVFSYESDTALILDLPGSRGVSVGMAAARSGYRPVPLYNALPPPTENSPGLNVAAVLDTSKIMRALQEATTELARLRFAPVAPPAFLLDANRRGGNVMPQPGSFDNRSVTFTTDFPSANSLQAHGISKALLVQDSAHAPQPDLAHTLLNWQQQGIHLASRALLDSDAPVPLRISKPSHFGRAWQRVLIALGLRRGKLGGFGGIVPEPSSG